MEPKAFLSSSVFKSVNQSKCILSFLVAESNSETKKTFEMKKVTFQNLNLSWLVYFCSNIFLSNHQDIKGSFFGVWEQIDFYFCPRPRLITFSVGLWLFFALRTRIVLARMMNPTRMILLIKITRTVWMMWEETIPAILIATEQSKDSWKWQRLIS